MSLRQKLLVPLLVVGLAMASYLYAIWIPASLREAEAVQVTLIERHLDSVVEGLIPLLLSDQLDSIHDNLGALQKKNGEWLSVRLVNGRGQQLYPVLSAPAERTTGGHQNRILRPIRFMDMNLGQLEVVVDMEPFLAADRARHRTLLAMQLGILLILLATIGLLLEIAVIRPARRLAVASRELAQRRFETPLPRASADEIGALVSSFATMRQDIKAYHDELLQQQDHLEEQVSLRTRELEHARDAAESANRAKSAFLANMSHELRTPLNAVLGFSELMARDADATVKQRENLDVINRSGQHLLSMINDVLDLSKIEAGRIEIKTEPIDLHRLLDDITTMFRVRTDGKGLQFLLDRSPNLPRYLKCDPSKLRQVLINLLGNSLKFTVEGGISLRVDAQPASAAYRLVFEVEDTGCGIPADNLSSIFDPFVQAIQGNAQQTGSGLGLTISRQLVHLMGGEITVSSEVGKGSVFRFEIPAEASEAPPVPAHVAARQVHRLARNEPEWRILVVDDKLENRQLLRQLLESVGFAVQEAEGGAACLDIFTAWHPQLIWMDMRMPGMDGYETTRQLRALPGGGEVRILAVTASVFDDQKPDILAAGCDDVVHKPYRSSEIFDAMARYLDVHYELECVSGQPDQTDLANWSTVPAATVSELRAAAGLLDCDAALATIAGMRECTPKLADYLQTLVKDFRFDTLIELCDLAGGNNV